MKKYLGGLVACAAVMFAVGYAIGKFLPEPDYGFGTEGDNPDAEDDDFEVDDEDL